MNNLNYPIRYAVQPIYLSGKKEIMDNLIGYTVTKCFIVKEIISHLSDGNVEIEYDVVFPYKDLEFINKELEMRIPEVKILNSSIIIYPNSNHINRVYEKYEEAKKASNFKNKRCNSIILEQLEQFEKKVLENTENMIVDTENNKVKIKV